MDSSGKRELEQILASLEELHLSVMTAVRQAIAGQAAYDTSFEDTGNGDVSYAIDTKSESLIVAWFEQNAFDGGVVVIAEGIGKRVFPAGCAEETARWRVILDPLDGTRHIMYDNRSCWILTGVAPNRGEGTSLRDIAAAIQTEVPTSLQDKCAVLTAIKGGGVNAKIVRCAPPHGQVSDLRLRPSRADSFENGFLVFSNFFPGCKSVIADIEERLTARLLGEAKENGATVFSEQYICNAGQLFMLMSGKYRMVADIRGGLGDWQSRNGKPLPLCSHPYDLSAILIAREAGCLILDENGGDFDAPLDLHTNCSWLAYANAALMQKAQPLFAQAKKEATHLIVSDCVMPNGERRYRMTGAGGSGYIRVEAGQQGGWQNAHTHLSFEEITVVQEGAMLAVWQNPGGAREAKAFRAGECFCAKINVPHNQYLSPGAVTHTVKYGGGSERDWHPHGALDAYSKALDAQALLA